jgi:dipeptidyl aminopeptidase/acylaminoacyl peptidase
MLLGATFSLGAMLQTVSLSSAAIAPNGSAVAFIASQADPDRNTYRDGLWLFDVGSGHLQALAGSHRSVSSPAWSPDGLRLAFIADDPASGAHQLFILNPKGGATQRVTSGKADVDDFCWRPDGGAIAFIRRDVAPVRHGAAAYDDAFEVTDNAYLETAAAQPRHLWTVDLRARHTSQLTNGAESVVDTAISWSPDGQRIAYMRAPNGIHGVQDKAAAYAYNVANGSTVALTPHAAYEDQALWSPDGQHLLYLFTRDGDPMNALDAMTIGADGTGDRDVSEHLDRHVDTAQWMPDGSALLIKVYDGTSGPLYELPLNGGALQLPMGDVVDAQISTGQSVAHDGTIAFIGTQAGRPSELYLLHPGASAPQRLTDFNHAIAAMQLGRVATVKWQNDGFDEQGVLTYPPDYTPGKKYPLVLRIHGGPTETSEAMFDPFYQFAATHGYLVFAPNYRGSSNLGNAFEHAIFNDASAGPGRDIMAGINAVENMGIVDTSRVAVSGWSYGGQLTSWMIGHYQIWKCAVTGAAVNDLVVDYTIADDIDAARVSFSDPPFAGDALSAWRAQSPITYFKDIHTPLLLLGNVYDVRVPIVEQYEMYHALRDNHVPVQFFAYPSGGHLPNGPVRLADAYRRWLDWFDRYLK